MKLCLLVICFAFFQYTFGYDDYQRYKRFHHPICRIPRKCEVKLLINEHYGHCKYLRQAEIARARHWYQITDQNDEQVIRFPLKHIPWLNQTMENVGAYYATDDFESGHLASVSFFLNTVVKIVLDEAEKKFKDAPFETPEEFVAVKKFPELIYQHKIKIPVLGNPTMHPDFTDHLTNNYWQTDDAFSQRRLAGQCPFTLQKIVEGKKMGIEISQLNKVMNKEILSMKFNIGKDEWTFKEAVDDGRLFVEYYEVMDHVKTDYPDLTPVNGKKMRPVVSTLTFFIINDDGHLSVVAIQTDSNPTAPVYTPNSPKDKWQLAKITSDSIQDHFCQAYVHFGHVHLTELIYCLSFRRHFSERHPLYDFFKFHCEGTVPLITSTYGVLISPKNYADIYFDMGDEGFLQLSNQAFLERQYGRFDYHNIINKRGLDDPRIKYYPFRDDAKLILDEYKTFAKRFTSTYYKHHGFRTTDSTKHDNELQSWAKELSEGLGVVPGFPKVIENHKMLEEIIVRFLWINIIHATTNYAMEPNFIPTAAPKLYEADGNGKLSPNEVFFNGSTAAAFATLRGRLPNFRVNRIFDYSDKVKDWKLKELVRQAHYRMHVCLQKKLEERNAERKKKNLLGYQFIEPKWTTNSIHV